jgi:hypothetical protein
LLKKEQIVVNKSDIRASKEYTKLKNSKLLFIGIENANGQTVFLVIALCPARLSISKLQEA